MNQHWLNLVWAAVTQEPKATVRTLADRTGVSLRTTQRALEELERLGHVLPAPCAGAPRQINVGLQYGAVSRQANSIQGIPILGEIVGGPDGQPIVRFYER